MPTRSVPTNIPLWGGGCLTIWVPLQVAIYVVKQALADGAHSILRAGRTVYSNTEEESERREAPPGPKKFEI